MTTTDTTLAFTDREDWFQVQSGEWVTGETTTNTALAERTRRACMAHFPHAASHFFIAMDPARAWNVSCAVDPFGEIAGEPDDGKSACDVCGDRFEHDQLVWGDDVDLGEYLKVCGPCYRRITTPHPPVAASPVPAGGAAMVGELSAVLANTNDRIKRLNDELERLEERERAAIYGLQGFQAWVREQVALPTVASAIAKEMWQEQEAALRGAWHAVNHERANRGNQREDLRRLAIKQREAWAAAVQRAVNA